MARDRNADPERIANAFEQAAKGGGTEGGYGRSGNGDVGAEEGYWGRREEPDAVDDRPTERRPDEELRAEIARRLDSDPAVDAGMIDVKVVDGEATLEGAADTPTAKSRAEDLARSVAGITRVVNGLRIERS